MTTTYEATRTESRAARSLLPLALFAVAAAFPPFVRFADASLTFHVFGQNLLVLLAGFLFGREMARYFSLGKPAAGVLTALGVLLVILWYVPYAWNFAHSGRGAYLLMHGTSFLAAALVALSASAFGEGLKWVLLMIYLDGSGILMAYTMGKPMYPMYSADQHMTLSIYLMLGMVPAFLLVFLSPLWVPRVAGVWNGRKLPHGTVPMLFFALAVTLI